MTRSDFQSRSPRRIRVKHAEIRTKNVCTYLQYGTVRCPMTTARNDVSSERSERGMSHDAVGSAERA